MSELFTAFCPTRAAAPGARLPSAPACAGLSQLYQGRATLAFLIEHHPDPDKASLLAQHAMLKHLRRLAVLTWDAKQEDELLPWTALWHAVPVLWRYRRHRLAITAGPNGELLLRLRQGAP